MPQGWTVRTATGGWSVARTLVALVVATAGPAACSSWAELAARIRERSRGSAVAADAGDVGVDYFPVRAFRGEDGDQLAALGAVAEPVLPDGDIHLRLTGFVLGVRTFEHRPVALDLADGRRLVASAGRALGLVHSAGPRRI